MHAEVDTVTVDPLRLGDVISYTTGEVCPALERQPGSLGSLLLIDPQAGVMGLESFWASDGAHAESEDMIIAGVREAARRAGGKVIRERYEVLVFERDAPLRGGEGVRVTQLKVEPSKLSKVEDAALDGVIGIGPGDLARSHGPADDCYRAGQDVEEGAFAAGQQVFEAPAGLQRDQRPGDRPVVQRWPGGAADVAGDQVDPDAVALDDRAVGRAQVLVAGACHLQLAGQVHPQLQGVRPLVAERQLPVDDPAPGLGPHFLDGAAPVLAGCYPRFAALRSTPRSGPAPAVTAGSRPEDCGSSCWQ
jgi:hypothetical protein